MSFSFGTWSQTGGFNSFQNLNVVYNARMLGLAGDVLSVREGDLNLVWSNPALLNSEMNGKGTLNESLLAGGINIGGLGYAKQFGKTTGAAHFRYISYGEMKRTDVNGSDLGKFSPGDFILGASAGKSINERLHIGSTLNILYSQLDNYVSFGTSLDIGGAYTDEAKRLVIGGSIKNLGVQWKGYTDKKNPLPLELQFGISHKLAHAPFRFSLVAQHLQQWDLSYIDPNQKLTIDPLSGDTIKEKNNGFFDKVARHAVLQTELLFGKKVHFRFGFDYQRRKELAVTTRPGLAGFSTGVGLYFKRFSLDYGWMIYSSAGSQHGLTLTLPFRRKEAKG